MPNSDIKPVFLFRRPEDHKFLVMTVKSFDWVDLDFQWAGDDEVGEWPSVPGVDIADTVWCFGTEQEALRKQAELYASQLSSSTLHLHAPECDRNTEPGLYTVETEPSLAVFVCDGKCVKG